MLTERQIKNETEEEFPSNDLTNEKELDPSDCLNHKTSNTQTSPYRKTFVDDFHPDNNRFHPYHLSRDHYREMPENRERFQEISDSREHLRENREHVRYSSSLSYPPSESHRRSSSVSYPKSPERYSSPLMTRFSPAGNRSASPSHVSDRVPMNQHLDRDLRQNSMVIPSQATFRRISSASPPSAEKMIPYSKY